MTAVWIVLYVIPGLIVGGIAAYGSAQDEITIANEGLSEPSPFFVIGAGISCAVFWPLVLTVFILAAIGNAIIHAAERNR
jgi:hypothetical protein